MEIESKWLQLDQKGAVALKTESIWIIEALEVTFSHWRQEKKTISYGEMTRRVKVALTKLGHQKCYRVYASHFQCDDLLDIHEDLQRQNCPELDNRKETKYFKSREWLYDLHWYRETGEPYGFLSMDLVVECEWGDRRRLPKKQKAYLDARCSDKEGPPPTVGSSIQEYFGAVAFDFQKLVTSNAKLRLMVFRVSGQNILKKLAALEVDYFQKVIDCFETLEDRATFLFVAYEIHNMRIDAIYFRELIRNSDACRRL
jgi:hypothetical protein